MDDEVEPSRFIWSHSFCANVKNCQKRKKAFYLCRISIKWERNWDEVEAGRKKKTQKLLLSETLVWKLKTPSIAITASRSPSRSQQIVYDSVMISHCTRRHKGKVLLVSVAINKMFSAEATKKALLDYAYQGCKGVRWKEDGQICINFTTSTLLQKINTKRVLLFQPPVNDGNHFNFISHNFYF